MQLVQSKVESVYSRSFLPPLSCSLTRCCSNTLSRQKDNCITHVNPCWRRRPPSPRLPFLPIQHTNAIIIAILCPDYNFNCSNSFPVQDLILFQKALRVTRDRRCHARELVRILREEKVKWSCKSFTSEAGLELRIRTPCHSVLLQDYISVTRKHSKAICYRQGSSHRQHQTAKGQS